MKIFGWILAVIGCSGLTGTLVARNSNRYRLDDLARIIGLDSGYAQTVDILFYLSIVALILGAILLVIGYIKSATTQNQPFHSQHPVQSSVNSQAGCQNCNTPVSGQFCPNCGHKVR